MVLQGRFPNQESYLLPGGASYTLLTQLVGWRLSEASSPNLETKETTESTGLTWHYWIAVKSALYRQNCSRPWSIPQEICQAGSMVNYKPEKGTHKAKSAGWAQFKNWNNGTYLELVVPRSQTKFPVSRTWLLSWSKLPSNHLLVCTTAVHTHPWSQQVLRKNRNALCLP